MPAKSKSFHGSWQIVHMDEWDAEYLDLIETARITIDKRGQGEFVFGAVKGWLDCRFTERDGLPFVEFSWEGLSEGDSVCGRGWASLQSDGNLEGRLFIHLSDDSAFVAKPKSPVKPPPRRVGGEEA
jgi:hypothetical protein